jgi:D-alanyl-D-alanine carboxypeptidase
MKGWNLSGIFIPLLLAPILEELGWRGYGVDSLRSHFNLFTTSLIFGFLWGLWHLPLFFIKGYYHNQLYELGTVYVVNFFVSVMVVAFLMNWIYYQTDRSIPALILFHSVLNLSSILLRTDPFTKCITTILLSVTLIIVISLNSSFFFDNGVRPPTPSAFEHQFQKALYSHKGCLSELHADDTTQLLNTRLQKELDLFRTIYDFPGATMSYVLSNGQLGAVATGLADIEKHQPMTPDSRMLAASIGKSFVAATILSLTKEGLLTLDDHLSNWLEKHNWYSRLPNCKSITLRHLLTHSSGLPDHVDQTEFIQLFSYDDHLINQASLPEFLVGCILDRPPLFEVGKGWYYTDSGYILLGLIIEAVTGNTYYDEVTQRFLHPCNLHQTEPSNKRTLPHLVAGYTPANNIFRVPTKTVDIDGILVWNPAIEWTGGGLISNSSDLARWAKLLYEGNAMHGDYLDDLLQSVSTNDNQSKISYGLGVSIEEKGILGTRYGHGGVIPGYVSSMRYYPKYKTSIAFQINTDIGVSDHSSDFVGQMEQRLAEIVISQKKEFINKNLNRKDFYEQIKKTFTTSN